MSSKRIAPESGPSTLPGGGIVDPRSLPGQGRAAKRVSDLDVTEDIASGMKAAVGKVANLFTSPIKIVGKVVKKKAEDFEMSGHDEAIRRALAAGNESFFAGKNTDGVHLGKLMAEKHHGGVMEHKAHAERFFDVGSLKNQLEAAAGKEHILKKELAKDEEAYGSLTVDAQPQAEGAPRFTTWGIPFNILPGGKRLGSKGVGDGPNNPRKFSKTIGGTTKASSSSGDVKDKSSMDRPGSSPTGNPINPTTEGVESLVEERRAAMAGSAIASTTTQEESVSGSRKFFGIPKTVARVQNHVHGTLARVFDLPPPDAAGRKKSLKEIVYQDGENYNYADEKKEDRRKTDNTNNTTTTRSFNATRSLNTQATFLITDDQMICRSNFRAYLKLKWDLFKTGLYSSEAQFAQKNNEELVHELSVLGLDAAVLTDDEGVAYGDTYGELAETEHWIYRRNANFVLMCLVFISIIIVGIEADEEAALARKYNPRFTPIVTTQGPSAAFQAVLAAQQSEDVGTTTIVPQEIDTGPRNLNKLEDRMGYYVVLTLLFLIFLAEFQIRFSLAGYFVFDRHKIDFIALLLNFLDMIIGLFTYTGLWRVGFLIRILRFTNLQKLASWFPSTAVIRKQFFGTKFKSILITIFWCSALLIYIANLGAILFTELLKGPGPFQLFSEYQKSSGYNQRHRYDRTIRTFGGLFQIISWDKGVMRNLIRPIIEIEPALQYLFLLVYIVGGLGLLNVLAAQICGMAVAHVKRSKDFLIEKEGRKRQMQLMQLENIFSELSCDSDGNVDLVDLENALTEDEVQKVFLMCEIPIDELLELMQVLDRDELGTLNVDEFLGACARIRGEAKSKDVYSVKLATECLSIKMHLIEHCVFRATRMMLSMENLMSKMERVQRRRDQNRNEIKPGKEFTQEKYIEYQLPVYTKTLS